MGRGTYLFLLRKEYHIGVKKIRFLTFFSTIPLLLSSCLLESTEKPDLFAQKEIAGTGAFSSLVISLDSESKTAKVFYNGETFSPVEVSYLSYKKEFVKEVKNEIGIKSTYEDEYFFYEVDLGAYEKSTASYYLNETISQITEDKDTEEARTLRGCTAGGVGIYVKRSLYEGKPSSTPEQYFACAILNRDTSPIYYNGNGLFHLVYR